MKKLFLISLLVLSIAQYTWSQQTTLIQNFGHNRLISAICLSNDKRNIISGDDQGTIILWDKVLAKEVRSFSASSDGVKELKFSPDGKSFFAVSGLSVFQFDLISGKILSEFKSPKARIIGIGFNPNAKELWAGDSNGEILSFDLVTQKLVSKNSSGKKKYLFDIGYSFNNNLILIWYKDSYSYKEIVIDNISGKTLFEIPAAEFGYDCMKFSSDGKYIVASISKRSFVILDSSNGNLIKTLNVYADLVDVSDRSYEIADFDMDVSNNLLYYATWRGVSAVNINTGESKLLLNDQFALIKKIPDANELLLTNYKNSFCLANLDNKTNVQKFEGNFSSIGSCNISNDCRFLAFSFSRDIKLIDLATGKINALKTNQSGSFMALSFFQNDTKIASLNGNGIDGDSTFISTFDLKTGKREKFVGFAEPNPKAFSISKNGDKVAVTFYKKGLVIVYDLTNGKELFRDNSIEGDLNSLTFTELDQKLIVGGYKKILVYDASSGSVLNDFTLHKQDIVKLCSSPGSNLILSAGGDYKQGDMKFWDVNTGKTIQDKFKGIDQFITTCAISPDNSMAVATLGLWFKLGSNWKESEIKVWDVKTGNEIGVLENENNNSDVFFSLKGDIIYSVKYNGEIGYWDSKTLKKKCTLSYISDNEWVAYTPEGLFDGSTEGIKKLHFANGLNVMPLESLYEQYFTPNLLTQVLGGESIAKSNVDISTISFPPAVKIITPENNAIITSSGLTINIKVTDQGGGIDEIRLYHNGKLLDGTTRGCKSTGQNHEFTVTLTNGENRIKATAFNSQRTESIPNEIVVHYKAPEIVKPNMHILAVGINTYLNPKYNLNYAKNDADAFVKSLSAGASLLFGKVEVTIINDANATKTGILAAIEKIKSASKAEDVFVFYYAGHGVMSTGTETEKPLFYLVPHDVTKMYEADDMLKKLGISANEIGEFSKNIKAQKQLFVIDACQSGGAMQTLAMRGVAEEKAIAQLARSTGTYFIAASGSEQFATEVAELGHGIFTYSVIEALKGSCKSQDGKVTVNLLKSCVEDLVPELSKKHKGQPQFPTGYGFGMDFPIVIVK